MSNEFRLRLVDLATHFQSVSGVPCYPFDGCGQRLARADDNPSGSLCQHLGIDAMTNRCDCVATHRRGIHQAERFGGTFIYFCPVNLVFWAAPVSVDGNTVGALVAGSVLMIEPEDYLNHDVGLRNDLNERDLSALLKRFRHIPYVPPARVTSLSKVLAEMALGLSQRLSEQAKWDCRIEGQQSLISAYIHQLKAEGERRPGMKPHYPLAKEQSLFSLITQGDRSNAVQALHELLAHVLFASGHELNLMRARVLELAVLISRAALQGGADPDDILAQSAAFLDEINRISAVEGLAAWLVMRLDRFIVRVEIQKWGRHGDLMHKAVQYLHANHHRRIDLQSLSRHLHIGAARFSKLFKDDMGQSVAHYLNHVRIERSKELLRDRRLPLVEIALRVGFEDQSYFTKVFGRHVGVSPGRYRKNRGQCDEANMEIHEAEPGMPARVTAIRPERTPMNRPAIERGLHERARYGHAF